ncbi:MAG: DUF1998 domain-containing protein [Clostridia bacterium]|jgi:hypothetical protein|nr:DUF1998 domain-containing protein [Clostridia bacterium]
MSELKTPKDRVMLNNITHTVRTAQAVLQYGVGAMVDFPDQTLMTSAPEYWSDKVVHIHDERLEKALKVDYFGMPGGKDEYYQGISYVRFPQWYFCPKCRRFQSLEKWVKEYQGKASVKQKEFDINMKKPKCLECKKDLVVTRVVAVCSNGHIDDFLWIKWVHKKNFGSEKPICINPELTFETGATASAGLEGLVVRCKTCKAKATLTGAFDKDAFSKMGDDFRCTGKLPWKNKTVICDEFPRAMQRGASSVYFPNVVSSLVIPPYSDRVNTLIEQSQEYKDCLTRIADYDEEERETRIIKKLDEWSLKISIQTAVDVETVKRILERRLLSDYDQYHDKYKTDSIKYRVEEYEALTGINKHELTSDDFVRESMNATEYEIPGVISVVLIHKIREVRALTGFSRLNPPGSSDLGKGLKGFVSVKEPETRWYPAYEVRGEGIFIQFNDEEIMQWVSDYPKVLDRANEINSNYSATYLSETYQKEINPKFILLHTIAHLLIRQLSFECGYNAASLRERIYCSSEEDGYVMSGILLYTASGDSEGTLGGLVRQGYSDCLPRIFRKAIEVGQMCSNDPVCISSEGQGRDALNLGACHACVLLPETSCEEFNVFLDRGVVIGTFDNSNIGFYSDWLVAK